MKALIIGAKGLAGSAFMRVLPTLGYECIPVDLDNYDDAVGSQVDVLAVMRQLVADHCL